jgi:carboxypeptidase Taq
MTQKVLQNNKNATIQQFKNIDKNISHLSSIAGLLAWDQKVMAPPKGRSLFSKAFGYLQTEIFKQSVSPELGDLLDSLSKKEVELDITTKAQVRERKKFFNKAKSIPTEVYAEYAVLTSDANVAWEKARENNDFDSYLPYLEKMVMFKRKFADYYGYEKHPYDALLDEYEPGLTVELLDPLFKDLREKSIHLLNLIKKSTTKTPIDVITKSYDIAKQKEFNQYLLPLLGFENAAGRLDETVHPFAQRVNTSDVRITTRYLENNLLSALFCTIHEAGHGIYEQRVDKKYEGTVLCSGASYGIHESQSRFLENTVGRSLEFWKYFYPTLQQYFPEQLRNITVEQFYQVINTVNPSYIRVEADELTYNLHIMIRYEIEKALIEGKIEARDLPTVWNEKMEEYLGITPPDDKLGVLQDVHWSFGAFGYFPSYSLGNLYAAQILNTLKNDIPHYRLLIEEGKIGEIVNWLSEKIHQYGKLYTPKELIVKVTGEELNANYLIEYLQEKYSNIYNI